MKPTSPANLSTKSMLSTDLQLPEPDWIPLSSAPIQILSDFGFLQADLIDNIKFAFREYGRDVQVEPDWQHEIVVRFGHAKLRLRLTLPYEPFWIEVSRSGQTSARLSADFWDFETRLREWHIADFGNSLVKADALRIAHSVISQLIFFLEALLEGPNWRIMARADHPQAPFEEIPYDVWRSYRITNGSRNIVSTEKGNYLFSVHIRPSLSSGHPEAKEHLAQTQANSGDVEASGETSANSVNSRCEYPAVADEEGPIKVAGSIKQEKACERHLKQLMLEQPKSPISKEECWTKAKDLFPGIAKKAFLRAWATATGQSEAVLWRKPGPRTGARNRTPLIEPPK